MQSGFDPKSRQRRAFSPGHAVHVNIAIRVDVECERGRLAGTQLAANVVVEIHHRGKDTYQHQRAHRGEDLAAAKRDWVLR